MSNTWTEFRDAYVTGKLSTPYQYIYMNLIRGEAIILFKKKFEADPVLTTNIFTHTKGLIKATAFVRNCKKEVEGYYSELQNPHSMQTRHEECLSWDNKWGIYQSLEELKLNHKTNNGARVLILTKKQCDGIRIR